MNFDKENLDNFFQQSYNLNNCDKEPIHTPGFIQSFAILVIASREDKHIVAVSENIESLGFDTKSLIGKPLLAVVEDETLLDDKDATLLNVELMSEYFNIKKSIKDEFIYIEIEKELSEKMEYEDNLIQESNTLEFFYFDIADKFYKISDFNRVMIYRFDEDYNGEVVAEEKDDDLESYLGLNYPASDIPKQVRLMYKLNPLRVIYDVDGEQIPLYPSFDKTNNRPWDLTPCISRGVSPIHIEYLKNMDVKSSMSVSIVDEKDKLVGLIAFHSKEATLMPFKLRETLKEAAKEVSQKLPFVEESEYASQVLKIEEIKNRLYGEIDNGSLLEADRLSEIASIAHCDGVAVIEDSKKALYEVEIESSYLKVFLENLETLIEYNEFVTRRMILHFSEIKENIPKMSGLLAFKTPKGWLLLFKKEQIESVNWAGKPQKIEEDGLLNPRKSFELWQENVKNSSKKWYPYRRRALKQVINRVYGE